MNEFKDYVPFGMGSYKSVIKNVPVIDTISLMQSTCLQIAELSRLIIYEDYKSYTKDAPKTIENLDLLIKHTKIKRILIYSNLVKKLLKIILLEMKCIM